MGGMTMMQDRQGEAPRRTTPCEADPEAWFPDHADEEGAAQAKAWCATCPVLDQCRDLVTRLEDGVASTHVHGVWAAQSSEERIAARPRKRYTPGACINGHPLAQGTYRLDHRGHRRCLTCERETARRQRERARGAA